ncbi:MAG: hypothetical protein GY781_06035 [Gammaproteobacteria bacterium]|nr:hypothetical protein [Gammaproteobacteria bacterium]
MLASVCHYVFDENEGTEYMAENPDVFPPEEGYNAEPPQLVPPERLPEIIKALQELGYSQTDLKAILGEYNLRVAKAVWK